MGPDGTIARYPDSRKRIVSSRSRGIRWRGTGTLTRINNARRYVDPTGHTNRPVHIRIMLILNVETDQGMDFMTHGIGGLAKCGMLRHMAENLLCAQKILIIVVSGENRKPNLDPDVTDKHPGMNTYHMAVDGGHAVGCPVYPIAPGIVVAAGWSDDFGNYVMVEHELYDNKFYSIYAHLGTERNSGVFVGVGEDVN